MAKTHYKLPYDTEIDSDIRDWIEQFDRTQKGEMVRRAIRFYMAHGDSAVNVPAQPIVQQNQTAQQSIINPKIKPVSERQKPVFNENALKGKV